jgi:hypothetical protein
MDVPVFQHRQSAAFGVAERERDLAPPAHLLAGGHGQSDPIGGGASASNGPADPLVRVVEAARDLDEVEHRIFHPGARRTHDWVPGPKDCIGPADDYAWDLHLRRMPGRWDRDRDERTGFIDHAVALGSRLVTQNGVRPGPEQGAPEHGLPGGLSGEGCVHAPLESLPSAVPHAAAHGARIDAGTRALAPGDGIALSLEQLAGWRW